MSHLHARLWTLVYVTLALFALISAQDIQSRAQEGQAHDRTIRSEAPWQEAEAENDTQSALDVDRAWAELRSLKGSSGAQSQLKRRSGLFRTTTYYARKGFTLLFMNAPRQDEPPNTAAGVRPKLRKPLGNAVRLLERAAQARNPDALYLLAQMNFYGNFSHPRNFREAFRRYQELATLNGNSSAQHMVGFMYATGIGNAVKKDQGKALLYQTFAARAGNTRAEMSVAYRHHAGIGTPRNCDEAARYYKKVADKAIVFSRSGPPGGLTMKRDAYRIADEEGGVYGRGASFSSSGVNAKDRNPNSDQNAHFDDLLELLELRSGELNDDGRNAIYSLGRLHYGDGPRTMRRSLRTAWKCFKDLADMYWDREGRELSHPTVHGWIAAKSAAYLGRFYLRGEGVRQNFAEALRYFKLGLSLADDVCQYEVGLMYLLGLGVRKDVVLAAKYFKESAQQELPAAQVQLGKLFLDQGDLAMALQYFKAAERHHHIEALYHLAEINNFAVGRGRDCAQATLYYKAVAEKAEALHSSFIEANAAYDDGDKETALIDYMMAAEQGYEAAQANVAFLLDEHTSLMPLNSLLPWKKPRPSLFQNDYSALVYWTRSARQRNIDSMVKMGDYYMNGYGVEKDLEKAASCYEAAQDMQHSAQAAWNLGWMHENGIGIDQDYHLAWRYYMLTMDISPESYLPVRLSLYKLYLRDWWNRVRGGKINSIEPESESKPKATWRELVSGLFDERRRNYRRTELEDEGEQHVHDPLVEGAEYLVDDIDAHVLESLLIFSLAGALAWLVYYRQQRQQEETRRRAQLNQQPTGSGQAAPPDPRGAGDTQAPQGNQQGNQEDRGLFPPPDDPNFNAWRAGGVGH